MRIFLLLFIFIFTNCGEQTTETSKEETTKEKPQEIKEEESSKTPFPVYTTFDQLEPTLHRKSDTTYVVNFWATWCKPCVAELPYFEELREKYKNEKVKVILVSLDFPKDIQKKLIPFVEDRKLKSEIAVLLDGKYNNWIDKVSPEWGGAIPATLIYDQTQRNFYEESFEDLADIEEELLKVFKK